jgi:tight adherence protein B
MRRWARANALRVAAMLAALSSLPGGAALARSSASASAASKKPAKTTTTPTPKKSKGGATKPVVTTVTTTVTTSTPAPPTTTTTTTTPKPKPKKHKRPPAPLSGFLGGGTTFPERSLILSLPHGVALTGANLRLTENGTPITGAAINPLANNANLGVIVLIDQGPGMSAADLSAAMAATRQLAALRMSSTKFGVITYGTTPSTVLPLTTSASKITSALKTTPWTASGSKLLPALSLAYRTLSRAKVSAGAVIVITNDATPETSGSNPAAVVADGRSSGVQTYAVGLEDAHYTARSNAELTSLGASLKAVPAAGLSGALTGAWGSLMRSDLITYHSAEQSHSAQVAVGAQVTGVPGAVSLNYTTPAAPKPKPVVHPRPAAPRVKPIAIPTAQLTSNFPAVVLPTTPPKPTKQSFWQSGSSVLLVAGAAALLVFAAVMLLLRLGTRRQLQARVASFIDELSDPKLLGESGEEVEEEEWSPGLIQRRKFWPGFVEQVAVGRFKRTPEQLVRLALWISLAAMGLWWLLLGSLALAMFLGALVGPIAIRVGVKRKAGKMRAKFSEQLPSHLHDLAGAMRVGRSFVGGLAAVAASSEEPIKGELDKALSDEQLGKPLEETLEAIGERMESQDMEQVALIAALHRRTGSNVTESLDRVAEGARERADLARELKALTAQSRMSSRILAALPVCLVVAMVTIAPSYAHPIFHTVGGVVSLVFSLLLVTSGYFVMKKIVDVKA